jgi:hypothetical protein
VICLSRNVFFDPKALAAWKTDHERNRDKMREKAKIVRERTMVGGCYQILRGRQGMKMPPPPLPGNHAGFALEVLKWKLENHATLNDFKMEWPFWPP